MNIDDFNINARVYERKISEIKDDCRGNLSKYTRKAFESIPAIENPNILDLGCGTGVPTLEIAGLTNGNILAIDSDKECLDYFKQKINELNLNEKISIIHGSTLTVSLPHIRFDIILAEGIFNIIGFKKSIVYFSKFLKTNGWFIIHDDFRNHKRKLRIFEKHHLKLVNSFILDEKVWWNEYYGCLEKRIMKFTNEITHNLYLVKNYKRIMSEIKMYKKNPMKMRSMYFILKKM